MYWVGPMAVCVVAGHLASLAAMFSSMLINNNYCVSDEVPVQSRQVSSHAIPDMSFAWHRMRCQHQYIPLVITQLLCHVLCKVNHKLVSWIITMHMWKSTKGFFNYTMAVVPLGWICHHRLTTESNQLFPIWD